MGTAHRDTAEVHAAGAKSSQPFIPPAHSNRGRPPPCRWSWSPKCDFSSSGPGCLVSSFLKRRFVRFIYPTERSGSRGCRTDFLFCRRGSGLSKIRPPAVWTVSPRNIAHLLIQFLLSNANSEIRHFGRVMGTTSAPLQRAKDATCRVSIPPRRPWPPPALSFSSSMRNPSVAELVD